MQMASAISRAATGVPVRTEELGKVQDRVRSSSSVECTMTLAVPPSAVAQLAVAPSAVGRHRGMGRAWLQWDPRP